MQIALFPLTLLFPNYKEVQLPVISMSIYHLQGIMPSLETQMLESIES
jgi:hypothetical protein